jgi:hypothetical protein
MGAVPSGPYEPTQAPGSFEDFQRQQYQEYLAQQQAEQARLGQLSQKLQSARQDDRCPECGSGDYAVTAKAFTKERGQVETKRCFDCGYPKLQRGSGMGSVTNAPVTGRARQVAHGGGVVNNFIAPVQGADGGLHAPPPPAFASEQGGPGR